MKSTGFVLVGTGQKYVDEIKGLICNLNHIHPDIPISVFSDHRIESNLILHQKIINKAHYGFWDKILYMYESRFDKTIFLDTDIYLTAPIDELFQMLDKYEIIAPHAPVDEARDGVPSCFPEFNTGVVGFVRSDRVEKFFRDWDALYKIDQKNEPDGSHAPDQPSFREVIYKSDIRFSVLPHEYNCMLDYPGFLCGQVKIIHGRNHNYASVAECINRSLSCRSYIPGLGIVVKEENSLRVEQEHTI